jgi:hypothetical protein
MRHQNLSIKNIASDKTYIAAITASTMSLPVIFPKLLDTARPFVLSVRLLLLPFFLVKRTTIYQTRILEGHHL